MSTMGGSPSSDWRQSGFSNSAGAPLIASLTLGLHDVSTDALSLATTSEVMHTDHARLVEQDLVGVLVGKGGVLLAELQQLTGVHVQLSDRSQYVIGMPQHRTLTLTGTPEAIGCVHTPHACVGHARASPVPLYHMCYCNMRRFAQWMMSQRLYSVYSMGSAPPALPYHATPDCMSSTHTAPSSPPRPCAVTQHRKATTVRAADERPWLQTICHESRASSPQPARRR